MAKSDNVVKKSEYDYLINMAEYLNIDTLTFRILFKSTIKKLQLKTKADKVQHFHRLIVLMSIDGEQHELEIANLQVIGLRMGFRPSLILKVISVLDNYPGGIIPHITLAKILKET